MSCGQCLPEDCIAPEGWVCKDSGNFYTTGEYAGTLDYFNITGASLEEKLDSVNRLLDYNTLQILKVLIADELSYIEGLEVIQLIEDIQNLLKEVNE